jgi:hypothetical protein
MKTNRAPLILAIVLLLLPVLYVGSYFALVVPGGWIRSEPGFTGVFRRVYYRWGVDSAHKVFWPLEQIDRKVRPRAWEPSVPVINATSPLQMMKVLGESENFVP